MNVLSVFDGMSCGQIALERAGYKVNNYFASEINKYAITVTTANYPNTIQLGGVREVRGVDLPFINLLLGGSPCQGFSFAGKQLNFDDPRSALFFEFVRLLEELRVKNPDVYFLLENVKMKKEYQNVISQHLGVEPIEINSALVSAQNRVRLYWTNIPGIKQPKNKGILLKDILETDLRKEYDITYRVMAKKLGTLAYQKTHEQTRTIYQKANTLMARGQNISNSSATNIILPNKTTYRKLTPLECERLQTVPDNYTNHVSDTQRYKILGNGWTVDVIAHILKYIAKSLI